LAIGLGIAANVAAGGGLGVFVWNLHRLVDQAYIGIPGNRKGPAGGTGRSVHCGSLMQLPHVTCSTRASSRQPRGDRRRPELPEVPARGRPS